MTPDDIEQITAIVAAAEQRITSHQDRAIEASEARTAKATAAVIAEVVAEAIRAAEERTQEFARDIETKLLNAFHTYSLAQTARLSTAETAAYNMGVRMAALEDRVLNLETRQRPPQ